MAKSLSIIDRRLRDAIESKLKLLTSATEEYFWHAGADLAARWKDAQAKLRRPVLRPLTVILQQFEAVADDTNQEINGSSRGDRREGVGGVSPGPRTRFNRASQPGRLGHYPALE